MSGAEGNFRRRLIWPFLFFFILGAAFLILFPEYPGLFLLSFLFSLVFLSIYAPKNLQTLLTGLSSGGGRGTLKRLASAAAVLILITAAGALAKLPILNPAAPPEAELGPGTLKLLSRIQEEVKLTAFLADESLVSRADFLLKMYERAQPLIRAETSLAFGKSVRSGEGVEAAGQNVVVVSSGDFLETVSPISKSAIDASLARLLNPPRLVYNLLGEGEKSVLDESPRGLSRWSQALEGRKIFLEDFFWDPETPVPRGAAAILAGPRMPLDPRKEESLKRHLEEGGRLLLLLDPLVAGVDPEFFQSYGMEMPEGLAADPDSALSGTESVFIVARDFPEHPVTRGLSRPVIFPLAGAVRGKSPESDAPKEKPAIRLLTDGETETPPSGKAEIPNGGDLKGEAGNNVPARTWALASTGNGSFLERDLKALQDGVIQPGEGDLPGPLNLASATELSNGGRLVLAADSDLASNAYIGYAGNAEFLTSALYWLTGEKTEPSVRSGGSVLTVTRFLARVFFFGPVVIWPLLVLGCWARFYLKRRKRLA
ncbi:MAG: hypothetical protein LBR53_07850 [Deltaproteobacteria bacterium]|jgi:hypothetical protein|nr:hypothetical protein [Deltaproteobacteria bacterium]